MYDRRCAEADDKDKSNDDAAAPEFCKLNVIVCLANCDDKSMFLVTLLICISQAT